MTGVEICRATRSAVRCRVPVSDVGISGSGTRCTLARARRDPSEARMIAPSIFASSDTRWGVNPASSRKPPEQMLRTSGPSPTTMSAPIFACKMRSMPSRSGVPGATSRNAAYNASDRRSVTHPPGRNQPISPPWVGKHRYQSLGERFDAYEGETAYVGRGFGDDRAAKSKTLCLLEPAGRVPHLAHFAPESELADDDGVGVERTVDARARHRQCDREVGARL